MSSELRFYWAGFIYKAEIEIILKCLDPKISDFEKANPKLDMSDPSKQKDSKESQKKTFTISSALLHKKSSSLSNLEYFPA